MSAAPAPTDAPADALSPAAQTYQVIGLAAVVVVGAALFQHGSGRWALMPVLIGAAGLAFRWRTAPPALLAAVAFALLGPAWYGNRFIFARRPTQPTEFALCLAVLVYAAAQYRLLALTGSVLPPDPLRPKDKPPPRPAETAGTREAIGLLLTVATATVAAFFLWELTRRLPAPWSIPDRTWRVGLMTWGGGAVLLLLVTVLGTLGGRRQSRAEATLYLQDALWAETRREQRRIQRWRAWAMIRAERKQR